MIDLDAIRKRNDARKSAPAGEYDRRDALTPIKDDVDALIAQVERLSGDCYECGEFHKTHPTREGEVGWEGHTCRCVRCLAAEVERLRAIVHEEVCFHGFDPCTMDIAECERLRVERIEKLRGDR